MKVPLPSLKRDAPELLEAAVEQPLDVLAATLGCVFWLTGPDGRRLLYVTPSCEQMWGTPAQVLYDDPLALLDCVHPEDRERAAKAMAHASDGAPLEYRIVRPDGSVRWIMERMREVRDARGDVAYVGGFASDITEIKTTALHVAQQRAFLHEVVDLSQALIFAKDRCGRILLANQAFAEVCGSTVAEITQTPTAGESVRAVLAQFEAGDDDVLKMGRDVARSELSFTTASGELRIFTVSKRPITPPGAVEAAVVTHARDITDLKAAEQAIRAINTDLEARVQTRTQESQRALADLAARSKELEIARDAAEAASRTKSAFLAAMSHEIRTPMNGVIGMVELLRHTRMSSSQRDCVETIRESAYALLTIIDDILDFSKIEAGRLELELTRIDPTSIVRRVCQTLSAAADQAGVELVTRIGQSLPEAVLGDPVRLRQILLNLADNAIKFSRNNEQRPGRVAVSVDAGDASSDSIDLRFTIQDNGIGITPHEISRLFQPFTQAESSTTRRFGGTGLGLSICKQLTELMHGSIVVQSEVGVGSTFCVTIPMRLEHAPDDVTEQAITQPGKSKHAARASRIGTSHKQTPRGRPRILVVEDNELNQKVTRRQLRACGFDADIAATGRGGVERWRRGHYALILADLHMPDMDGYDMAREIRRMEQAGQRVPIVAFTANAIKGEAQNCMAAGMDDCLTKPVQLPELKAMLNKWIHEQHGDQPVPRPAKSSNS